MAVTAAGAPPTPNAPALVVLEYFIAGHPLHMNLYLQELGDPTVNAGGNPDFAYNDSGTFLFGLFESTSNEPSVTETIVNFLGKIKGAYGTDVGFAIKSCWKRASEAGELVEVFPTPALGSETGTVDPPNTPTAAEAGCFTQHILTARGGNGGRYRISMVGADPLALAKPVPVIGDAAGTPYEKLVAYLKTKDCRVLAHDGGKPSGSFVHHVGPSAKLRRSQNWA